MDNLWVRASLLLLASVIVLFYYRLLDRRLPKMHKFIFRFILLSYIITYFTGASLIFLIGKGALSRYFIDDRFIPPTSEIMEFFLLTLLPFGVIGVIAALPNVALRTAGAAMRDNGTVVANKSSYSATILTTITIIVMTLVILGGLTSDLIKNGLSFGSTRNLSALYLARGLVFERISFIQGGLLYGTLPALSAGLLLYQGQKRKIVRFMAFGVTGVTILINLGLYQTAPLFAFFFILGFVKVSTSSARIFQRNNVALGVALFVGLYLYSTIKSGSASTTISSVLFEIVMRMPVGGPFLVELGNTALNTGDSANDIPRILGLYMFPEFLTRTSNISIPQPSFMVSWYLHGAFFSAVLLFATLLVPFWLSKLLPRKQSGKTGFVTIVTMYGFAHYIYYIFQINVGEILISSYGFVFPLLPALFYFLFYAALHKRPARRRSI